MSKGEDSGRSTPTTLDTDAVEVLSDSVFNSDVEQNWSVIFTDDNNSTDNDLKSNYSSSEADDDILQESLRAYKPTDGDGGGKVEPKSVESSTIESASVSTLRMEKSEQSLHMPNLTNEKRVHVAATCTEKTGTTTVIAKDDKKFGAWYSLKVCAVYGILGLLVIDKSLDLFGIGIFHSNIHQTNQTIDPVEPYNSILTVIKYATTTRTLFIPGQTVTFESTLPAETIYEPAETIYEAQEGLLTGVSSWSLVKALYDNAEASIDVASHEWAEKFKRYGTKAALAAWKADDELQRSSLRLFEKINEVSKPYYGYITDQWEKASSGAKAVLAASKVDEELQGRSLRLFEVMGEMGKTCHGYIRDQWKKASSIDYAQWYVNINNSQVVNNVMLASSSAWEMAKDGARYVKESDELHHFSDLGKSTVAHASQTGKDLLKKDFRSLFQSSSSEVLHWVETVKEQFSKSKLFDTNYLKCSFSFNKKSTRAAHWWDTSKKNDKEKTNTWYYSNSGRSKSQPFFNRLQHLFVKATQNADGF